jgi:hypothetical protein
MRKRVLAEIPRDATVTTVEGWMPDVAKYERRVMLHPVGLNRADYTILTCIERQTGHYSSRASRPSPQCARSTTTTSTVCGSLGMSTAHGAISHFLLRL